MYPRLDDLFTDLFGLTWPFESIHLYSFGFMMAIAFLAGKYFLDREVKRMQDIGQIKPIKLSKPKQRARNKKDRRTQNYLQAADLTGTITLIALGAGVAGSKLFYLFEQWDRFTADPLGTIFSAGGLTFYGGLICAGLAIAWYVNRKGISVPRFADAIAPSLILAYGIGRVGCHLSGDGDWGIQAFLSEKPGFIPGWLWAEDYPNNILGVTLPGDGVYPTPVYEFAMAAAIFGILWMLRKHPYKPGWLFSVYVLLNGLERFLIEKIRVNDTFNFLGFDVTQAELISFFLMLAGLAAVIYTMRRPAAPIPAPASAKPDSS